MNPIGTFPKDDQSILSRVPGWVTSARVETLEDVAFLSGAVLGQLHLVMAQHGVPHALLRDRLALRAAEACVVHSGRAERAADLRDGVHLVRPGDQFGPAGDIYAQWRRVVERPVSVKALCHAMPGETADQIATWLDAGQGGKLAPLARAAAVLQAVAADRPRGEATVLMLADAALAQALGWEYLVPLVACGLKRSDLRKTGEELRMACHAAVAAAGAETVRHAAGLSRRADRLKAVAPKLRAKGAGEAVGLFLSRDAVAPSALPLPDRAARRLCDRLVELGVVRELTGRDTFRLYGV